MCRWHYLSVYHTDRYMTLATPILFVPPPPPGIEVAAQQEARDLFSSMQQLIHLPYRILRTPPRPCAKQPPRHTPERWLGPRVQSNRPGIRPNGGLAHGSHKHSAPGPLPRSVPKPASP